MASMAAIIVLSQLKRVEKYLNITYPIEMTIETVLTCILFTTLRTNHVSVLILEVNILDVTFERHFVEILKKLHLKINSSVHNKEIARNYVYICCKWSHDILKCGQKIM